MVQPDTRLRLPYPRRGDGGHLRPYGDAAPPRGNRIAAGTGGVGTLRSGGQGPDGRGSASGCRHSAGIALKAERVMVAPPEADAIAGRGFRLAAYALMFLLL